MAFRLRPAGDGDLEAITAIYRHAVLDGVASYEIEPPSVEEMAARLSKTIGQGYPYLVAEDAAAGLLGYAYASAFRTRTAYRFLVEDSIYLDPRAQGLGIGGALLTELVNQCEALGFRQMLAVIGGAHPASVALHARCGFVHAGKITGSGYKHGRWLDTILMQKALGEGARTNP